MNKELWTKVEALDLEPVMVKLMDQEDGEGWTLEQAASAVAEYRKFLYLSGATMLNSGHPPVVPWGGVDTVWHTHILDTLKYQGDCEHVFGRMLHHFPYFGMRGASDKVKLVDSARRTLELVLATFGEFVDDMIPKRELPMTCTGKWCGAPVSDMSDEYINLDRRPRLSDVR